MQIKLVGIQDINFINTKGEEIKGKNLFCLFNDPNVKGLRCQKFYLREGIKLPDCKLNENLEIGFDMRGKIEAIKKEV